MQKQKKEMELGLSLGDASNPFGFMEIKARQLTTTTAAAAAAATTKSSLGFCVGLSIGPGPSRDEEEDQLKNKHSNHDHKSTTDITAAAIQVGNIDKIASSISTDPPPVQLDLLPNTPVNIARGFDVNRGFPVVLRDEEPDNHQDGSAAAAALSMSSSPPNSNSAASSFQMDFCIYSGKGVSGSNELLADGDQPDRASSRASDEDENGCSRKKLRLSKQQSAFLEESFKEHNTLNPKQKLALARQLNLRPRQVEVWFQNRRARTKLKQTEVDCEYLKRCCETLTEENRRLHKELQELRALKASNPFYMQLPATTLTMCPSCERVATSTTTTSSATPTANINNSRTDPAATSKPSSSTGLSTNIARSYPFSRTQTHPKHHQPKSS